MVKLLHNTKSHIHNSFTWLIGFLRICLLANLLALNTRKSTKRRFTAPFGWVSGVRLTLGCLELVRLMLDLLGLVACFTLVYFALLAYIARFALLCLASFDVACLVYLALLAWFDLLAWFALLAGLVNLLCFACLVYSASLIYFTLFA